MEKKISQLVSEIIDDCKNNSLELVSGSKEIKPILFNQRDILRKIDFYINNKYTERDDDAIFWNISNHRITHFAKLISPDTKDFYPYGLGQFNFLQAWALRKKVKEWFDNGEFYKTLNDTGEGLATYGSEVWKKHKEKGIVEVEEVKLDKLYFDQSVEWIEDSNIVELHELTTHDLWEKDGIWDNVVDVFKTDRKAHKYEVWEFTGYYSENEDEKPVYKHVIGHGYGQQEIILWEEEITQDECPYLDFHLGKYRGTWLRMGVVQRLFDLQERTNTLVNQNAQSTAIASLLLLKSANADITGNVLEQAVNGQIIGDETLQQIGITNTGLNQFVQELQLINQQADKLCLTPEIVQGEASPSNTTFRGIAVVNAGAVTAFKNYRQDFFEKVANFLLKEVFPTLVKKWSREKTIEMAEDEEDVEAYDKAIIEDAKRQALLNGNLVTPELEQQITLDVQENMRKIGRRVEPSEDFFNFKWGFKMVATDESVDKSAQNDAYFNGIQMTLSSQGAVNDIPLFKQYLENNGISPQKMTASQKQELQQAAMGSQGAMPEPRQPDKLLTQAKQLT